MSSSRKLIGTLAAVTCLLVPWATAAQGAPESGARAEAVAAVPDTIPLTITNNSDRGDQVFLYVLGERNGDMGYADASGTFHPWPDAGSVPEPAPDASIPGPARGQSTTIQMPKLSGRVYFSYGTKMTFQIVLDGRLVQPAVQNPNDPNRDIMFSWTEYTLNDSGLWINSTQVDFFSAPYQTGLRTSSGEILHTGMLKPDGFSNVVAALDSTPGWDGLKQTAPDGSVLRVLSPGHGIGTGQISPDVITSYVDDVWERYRSRTMTVVPYGFAPDTKFYGNVSGDTMRFTDGNGAFVTSFNKPSAESIFGCAGDLFAPNDDVGAIARTLCAGFHRSTLLLGDVHPGPSSDTFYEDGRTNYYGKYIHEQMADGKAYAFAFDDVENQESLVHDGNPTEAFMQLDPFAGAATPIGGDENDGGDDDTPPDTALPEGTGTVLADNGMCMDVPWADASDGNPIQIVHCSGNAAQTWTRSGGTISALGKCLDVAGGGTGDGTAVHLWTCNGTGAQEWTYDAGAQHLVNPQSGKCLAVIDGALQDGQKLEIRSCGGSAAQSWRFGAS
ncbi:beta-1,3-glucanase family protein [Myceligenerans salitolerans]|uniref:Ricin-type beta-trefoil lectin domain protein n=1 Tax=Myceligenerans salitolerans TaxID=1230528 RepID=A0ABS3I5G7_9MICO|nr:beta-1,3-glucanase family protein [Myceligenerans salitolerans]MBO0608231.1 ricin-type beta-trefoil lectin domain protein [Myceligenerans salitolerans]